MLVGVDHTPILGTQEVEVLLSQADEVGDVTALRFSLGVAVCPRDLHVVPLPGKEGQPAQHAHFVIGVGQKREPAQGRVGVVDKHK